LQTSRLGLVNAKAYVGAGAQLSQYEATCVPAHPVSTTAERSSTKVNSFLAIFLTFD
jgi:hypothetical protein